MTPAAPPEGTDEGRVDPDQIDVALDEVGDLVARSRVAELLLDGDVRAVARIQGRAYELSGVVEVGDRRGRSLGFPTANLPVPSSLVIPAEGVYCGYLIAADGVERPAAISLGRRPTFYPDGFKLVEAHVVDWDGDLYGQRVTIRFHDRIRGQVRFWSVDELVEQLHDDVAHTRRFFRMSPEAGRQE